MSSSTTYTMGRSRDVSHDPNLWSVSCAVTTECHSDAGRRSETAPWCERISACWERLNVPCGEDAGLEFLSDIATGFGSAPWCERIAACWERRKAFCGAGTAFAFPSDADKRFGSTPLFDRITARSIRFWSSRTFPGQECEVNARIVSSGIW